jgi:hypothetical protein
VCHARTFAGRDAGGKMDRLHGRTARRRLLRVTLPGETAARADLLAAEEPLGIRVNGTACAHRLAAGAAGPGLEGTA